MNHILYFHWCSHMCSMPWDSHMAYLPRIKQSLNLLSDGNMEAVQFKQIVLAFNVHNVHSWLHHYSATAHTNPCYMLEILL